MTPDEFRLLGHRLIDELGRFLESLPRRPVTRGETPDDIRQRLGEAALPLTGTPAESLLEEATALLVEHSLFNGHPRFWGYITSSAAPIGVLGDLLASAVNPNVGAWVLSPVASEIEAQTIRWLAELVGYPTDAGGLLVSGGNMANFVGFLAARTHQAPWGLREKGLRAGPGPLAVYVSAETHTWIQKAADLFGLGTDAIRWIETDARRRMDVGALERRIVADVATGHLPFLVVGTAGSVGVGAIDPLGRIADVCRQHRLWFHVDGAYGAPAATLPEAPEELKALREADSLALDPHKWLYAPLEAGCVLVRDRRHLIEAFSFHPEYYNFDLAGEEAPINYFELGPQNSRGFRALKVWLGLRQVGREGAVQMIRDDIALAQALHTAAESHPELQAFTHGLSIATFRYVPKDLAPGGATVEAYLNDLNRELLNRLQAGGEAFVSNAVIDGTFVLRACIVNFRTTLEDVLALPGIVARIGKETDAGLRPAALHPSR